MTVSKAHRIPSKYRLGVDGGGTGCRARLADATGQILGEGSGGPANIGLGVDVARASIMQATHDALASAGLSNCPLQNVDAGLGLAGANVFKLRTSFETKAQLPFRSIALRSDAEIACIGALGGNDGAILILGTGSQGVVHLGGTLKTVGGWGFAISDWGSGAILGRAAIRRSLLAHQGIEKPSPFTQRIMDTFDNEPSSMLEWASSAQPRSWGEFARTTFEHALRGDEVAMQLVRSSASDVNRILNRLVELGAQRIVLMGGVAQPTRDYLDPRFKALLVDPIGDALDGALQLCAKFNEAPIN